MSAPPFSWLWGDPAESLDRLRVTRERRNNRPRQRSGLIDGLGG